MATAASNCPCPGIDGAPPVKDPVYDNDLAVIVGRIGKGTGAVEMRYSTKSSIQHRLATVAAVLLVGISTTSLAMIIWLVGYLLVTQNWQSIIDQWPLYAIPLIALILGLALVILFHRWVFTSLSTRKLCRNCGRNLRGTLVAGIRECPECGTTYRAD